MAALVEEELLKLDPNAQFFVVSHLGDPTRTAQTGPWPLDQDAAVATRIADIRRACEINGWPDDCIADKT